MSADWDEGIKASAACRLTGITYRQLDYWARTELVRPSIVESHWSGVHRRYSRDDLDELRITRAVLAAGLPLERCRMALSVWRSARGEMRPEFLVVTERSASVAADGAAVLEGLDEHAGVAAVINLPYVLDPARVVRRAEGRAS